MGTELIPPPLPSSGVPGRRLRTFAAFRHRDFRLLWGGMLLSLIGGWMQQVAGPWLVYRLTDSALALGLVAFIAAIPAAPLSLVAGPIIDRLPRRSLIIVTQFGLFLPPIGLALLTWAGVVQVWHVVLAELLRGIVVTIDVPAKQVAVVEMTGKEDVGSAIALWSAAISVARVVGPALAGLIVVWADEGLCFFINGVTYMAVVVALLFIHLPAPQPQARRSTLTGSLLDGWKYLAKQRSILAMAGISLIGGVFVRPVQTLLPIFADDVLSAGVSGLGFLTAAIGVGAMLGALGAASLRPRWQRPFILIAGLVLPCLMALFAFSHSFILSCGLLLLVGGWLTVLESSANALILSQVHEEFRGRVMSLFSAAGMGAPRVGGLQAGWLASLLGAPMALGLGAALALICYLPVAWLTAGNSLRRRIALVVGIKT